MDVFGFIDVYKVEVKYNKCLGIEGRDICVNIILYIFKYIVFFISLFFGGNMYGIKIIIVFVILGLFNVLVKGK